MNLSSATLHQHCRATLAQFISSSGLFDVWRCQHSSEKDFTIFSNVHHTYSRIDLLLVDTFILQKVKADIHYIMWSDHAPIYISVGVNHTNTRANRWRNDVYTLSQPENTKQILKALK